MQEMWSILIKLAKGIKDNELYIYRGIVIGFIALCIVGTDYTSNLRDAKDRAVRENEEIRAASLELSRKLREIAGNLETAKGRVNTLEGKLTESTRHNNRAIDYNIESTTGRDDIRRSANRLREEITSTREYIERN